MNRIVGVVAVGLLLSVGVASAQHQMPAQPGAGGQQPQSGMCGMEMAGSGGGGGMMGGMMGGRMMGMMGGGQADNPKMMQMRGEMMKAMGDVMIKYGKEMEAAAK